MASYRLAEDPEQLQTQIVQSIVSGVSTRDVEAIKPSSPGVKRSNVSRLWQEAGSKIVEKLRGKELKSKTWCALMLDGIRLSSKQTAVVALGIDSEGRKHVLDFALRSSEKLEVSRELGRRIVTRDFSYEHRLYAVLDGSDALRAAVKEFFADAIVERCVVHKERNIKGKLSKRHWGELPRLFRRLRSVQGIAAAEEVLGELGSFLQPIKEEAFRSLHEAGNDLLALHRLEVPNPLHCPLHCPLLGTNAIENSFRNTRRMLGRVTPFRADTDSGKQLAILRVAGGVEELPSDRRP